MKHKWLALAAFILFLGILVISLMRSQDSVLWEEGLSQYQSARSKYFPEQKPEVEEINPVPVEMAQPAVVSVIDYGKILVFQEQLEEQKQECTARIERILPDDSIVDPQHGIYQLESRELFELTYEIMFSFVSQTSQQVHEWVTTQVNSSDDFDAYQFKELLFQADICFHPRGLMFLQVLVDAADVHKWSVPQRRELGTVIITQIYEQILLFPSSNNLIFALSAIRSLARGNFVDGEDVEEAELLSSRVVEQYERVGSTLNKETGAADARESLREYLDENDLLRQQVRDVLRPIIEGIKSF